MRWLFLVGSLVGWVLVSGGCENNPEDPNNARCEYEGTCWITYTYDDENKWQTQRTCDLSQEENRLCGDCWDRENNSEGFPVKKTCKVCNLCKGDLECITDSDCGNQRPFCQTGSCVACRSSSDCSASERPFCSNQSCVQCRNDSDCSEEQSPQCLSGLCGGCTCPDGQQCRKGSDGQVTCVECLSNSDCKAPKPTCDTETFTCKPDCMQDGDCPNDGRCNEGACVQCSSTRDCGGDLQRPQCIEGTCGCANSSDCSVSFPFCQDNRCVQCRQDVDCPAGFPRCSNGECQPRPCLTDIQCVVADYNKCLAFGTRRVCLGCLRDADCEDGKTCDPTLRCVE